MKIAFVGPSEDYEAERVEEEAKKRGHEIKRFKITDIILGGDGTPEFFLGEENALDYDAFLFRNITKHIPQILILSSYLCSKGKVLLDERLGKGRYITSKFSTLYKLNNLGIPIPRSYMALSMENAYKLIEKLGYPIIIKAQMGSQGRGVYKAENKEEVDKILNEDNVKSFVLQENIENHFDLRVLVIGNKVLGAMKRTAPKGDFRNNISVGGKGEVFELSEDLAALALKAAHASGNELSGVDIIIGLDNKPYVIEINRVPGFKGFEKSTGINVAGEIIKYLESKFEGGGKVVCPPKKTKI